jgi:GH25 family lysozyme M1 (1,4-beta-N-acetylmuramidase)
MRTSSPRHAGSPRPARSSALTRGLTAALTRRLTAAATAVAAMAVLGAVGWAHPSHASAASTPGTVRTGSVLRFNVGAAHSPKIENALAGTPAVAPGHAAPRSARVTGGGAAATASTVQGIDVSSAQHPNGDAINWSEIASDGYKFAFIKVTEGSYYVNSYYAQDAAGAGAAGLFWAPYAFAIPNYSGGALQADYALDNVRYGPDGRMLPLILDAEFDPYAGHDGTPSGSWCYGLSTTQMVNWIGAFVTEAKRRTGQAPVIYTVADWWKKCTNDATRFTADPLWIADPNSKTSPMTPPNWTNWTYWQYTSAAHPVGIPETSGIDTDASWLSTSALELAAPGSQSNQTGATASLQLNALTSATTVSYSETGLPGGTSIDPSSGLISGALPESAGTFGVSASASATGTTAATQKFSWYVHSRPSFGSIRGQSGSVGNPVLHQLAARDGLSGCTLQYTATGLPHGLSMNTCGMISGWLTGKGTYQVSVSAWDSSDPPGSGAPLAQGSLSWRVAQAGGRRPEGSIRLNRNGTCLTALSRSDIAIEKCSSAFRSAQRWSVGHDDTMVSSFGCLTAEKPATSSKPATLHLSTCTGGTGQRWQPGSRAVLTNTTYGRCLADVGPKSGGRAFAAVCTATSNATGSASTPSSSQQWTLPSGPLTSGIAGYCASSLRAKSRPAGAVTLRACNSTSQQAWTIEPNGTVSNGGKCLGLSGGHTAPGTAVRLVTCSAKTATQKWQLSGGPIGVRLLSPAAGLCLSDPGDQKKAGQLLEIGPCVAGDPGISWRVS